MSKKPNVSGRKKKSVTVTPLVCRRFKAPGRACPWCDEGSCGIHSDMSMNLVLRGLICGAGTLAHQHG